MTATAHQVAQATCRLGMAAYRFTRRPGPCGSATPRTWRLTRINHRAGAAPGASVTVPAPRGRQALGGPGPEPADHVGGPVQAQVQQRRRGQAGGVSVDADHDDPVVVAGNPGQPGVRARIEPPLQMVALHDGGPGYLALPRPLRGGPDVDEHAAEGYLAEGLLRGEPPQADARGHQDLVDGAGPRRPDRHHAAAPSVSRLTSPPGVRS